MLRPFEHPRRTRSGLSPREPSRIFNVDTQPGGMMRAKIQKWGNSLALRIPKGVADLLGLEDGCEVELTLRDARLIVKTALQQEYTLEELAAQITDENRHDEITTGPSVGNEAW